MEIEQDGETHRIGVIQLPTFYIEFEALQRRDPNYRSSTRDVRKLLEELQEEDVDSIVVDLRRNGGRSLSGANSLVGLFIRRGPTVQVRDADGNNIVQGDNDPSIVYDGPLAVLVNRLSASASEIFAGAIQDYQRGVVLGSQTFGKGTVQELIPMDEGQMKITRAKFYRISGESTQHKGVTPDIIFPDLFDTAKDIGEDALPTALPWDTIAPSIYQQSYGDLQPLLPTLVARHDERLASDPDFIYIRAQIERILARQDDNQITLHEEKLIAEREEDDAWRLQAENARRVAKGLEPLDDVDELESAEQALNDLAGIDSADTDEAEEDQAGAADASETSEESDGEVAATEQDEEEEQDPYLVESGRILLDLRALQDGVSLSLAADRR